MTSTQGERKLPGKDDKMIETFLDFIRDHMEYTQQCESVYGENSIEYITAQYAADILLQLADDLDISII